LTKKLNSNIKQKPHFLGHRQRLKERFLTSPQSLQDYEIVEMLLFAAHPRRDVKKQAKEILADFGSISALLNADLFTLQNNKNINQSLICSLKLNKEIFLRSKKHDMQQKTIIHSWQDMAEYCQNALSDLQEEQFRVLFLDRNHRLIADELQKNGTADNVNISIKEISKAALNHNATAVILAHNHPSGSCKPSRADIDCTEKIAQCLKMIAIKTYDHLIIGANSQIFSFKNENLI
jgi:DNA repair protein RadC